MSRKLGVYIITGRPEELAPWLVTFIERFWIRKFATPIPGILLDQHILPSRVESSTPGTGEYRLVLMGKRFAPNRHMADDRDTADPGEEPLVDFRLALRPSAPNGGEESDMYVEWRDGFDLYTSDLIAGIQDHLLGKGNQVRPGPTDQSEVSDMPEVDYVEYDPDPDLLFMETPDGDVPIWPIGDDVADRPVHNHPAEVAETSSAEKDKGVGVPDDDLDSGTKPWNQIPDHRWDRYLIELLHTTDLDYQRIATRINTKYGKESWFNSIVAKTARNRASKLRKEWAPKGLNIPSR